jgi:hypothetical protein
MQINVGKKKVLFGPEHPYFKVEDQFKELKDNNFGLPIPKEAQIVTPAEDVFKPAKTISEATNYALKNKFAKKVDFSGANLEQVNAVNKGIFKTRQKIKNDVLELDSIDFKEKKATARGGVNLSFNKDLFNPGVTDGLVSVKDRRERLTKRAARLERRIKNLDLQGEEKNKVLKEISKIKKEIKEVKNYYVSDKMEDIVVHELGHTVQDFLEEQNQYTNKLLGSSKDREKAGIKWADSLHSKLDIIAKKQGGKISEYATKNSMEYISESFTHYIIGKNQSLIYKELLDVFKKISK